MDMYGIKNKDNSGFTSIDHINCCYKTMEQV